MMFVLFYIRRQVEQVVHGWLLDEIDLNSYCSYFDNIVQQKTKLYQRSYFQQSLITFSQYHYFRGEFEEALDLLSLVDLSRVAWVFRKRYEVIMRTYQLLSRLNQKDFEAIEEELASYCRLKGKIVTKNIAVMQAMYLVLSGKTTDYFSQTTPKHKLHGISSAYYQGLNLLNQDKTDQAKVSFESIIHENPDLFYVKEARNHLREFTS